MEETEKKEIAYEEIVNEELKERGHSSKKENEKKLTNFERLTNFILAGCQYNMIYYMLNYVCNGYDFDEQTKNECLIGYLNAQNNYLKMMRYIPSETIEKNIPKNDFFSDIFNLSKYKIKQMPLGEDYCSLVLRADFYNAEYLETHSFWVASEEFKVTDKDIKINLNSVL